MRHLVGIEMDRVKTGVPVTCYWSHKHWQSLDISVPDGYKRIQYITKQIMDIQKIYKAFGGLMI